MAVGVAVDGAGDVDMSDQGDNTLKVWSAATTLEHAVPSGLNTPYAIAVDWVGNVYIADTGNNAIKAWTVASNSVTTLAGTASMPYGVELIARAMSISPTGIRSRSGRRRITV